MNKITLFDHWLAQILSDMCGDEELFINSMEKIRTLVACTSTLLNQLSLDDAKKQCQGIQTQPSWIATIAEPDDLAYASTAMICGKLRVPNCIPNDCHALT